MGCLFNKCLKAFNVVKCGDVLKGKLKAEALLTPLTLLCLELSRKLWKTSSCLLKLPVIEEGEWEFSGERGKKT